MSTAPDLASYDRVIVALSGGKDSIACFLHLLERGVPREKIECLHYEIDGREGSRLMDWACTPGYCRAFVRTFKVPIYFAWKVDGFEGNMLRDNAPTLPTFRSHDPFGSIKNQRYNTVSGASDHGCPVDHVATKETPSAARADVRPWWGWGRACSCRRGEEGRAVRGLVHRAPTARAEVGAPVGPLAVLARLVLEAPQGHARRALKRLARRRAGGAEASRAPLRRPRLLVGRCLAGCAHRASPFMYPQSHCRDSSLPSG